MESSGRFFKPECLYGNPDGPGEADYFDPLPDAVIRDILSRLPIQQLVWCNQVCRRWHSLLGSPFFAQEHEKRYNHTSQVPVVCRRGKKQEDGCELIFLRNREARKRGKKPVQSVRLSGELKEKMSWPQCTLRGTYNGLLLFEGDRPLDSTYCILNPLTGEAARFTNPDRVCGLYFHPPSGRYRLLCYRQITGTDSFLYYVCSTGQEPLKEVGTFEYKPAMVPNVGTDIPAVAVKGLLCWSVRRWRHPDHCIMTFDVVSETLKLRPHPKGPPDQNDEVKMYEHWSLRLFEMGDRLYSYMTTQREMGMEVWILEDTTNWRWAKAFAPCLDLRHLQGVYFYRSPLTIEDGGLVFIMPRRGVFKASSDPGRVRCIGDRSRKKDVFIYVNGVVNWRRSLVLFRDYL